MAYFFEDLKNRFDFFLRSNITLSRRGYKEIPHNSQNIQCALYENLSKKYDLAFFDNLNTGNFLENLYFLNVFDKFLTVKPNTQISVLDIGSKNWSYVKSEYLFFKSFSENICLDGIELDAYRLCSNLYNRYEIAKFYKKNLTNTNYIASDFLKHKQNYDYIIWILPFITKYPLIKWGLPLKYFKPEEMLLHAYDLLNNNGQLLIINQGEKEAEIQNNLLQKINLPVYFAFEKIEDDLKIFKNKRYCFKIIKQ